MGPLALPPVGLVYLDASSLTCGGATCPTVRAVDPRLREDDGVAA